MAVNTFPEHRKNLWDRYTERAPQWSRKKQTANWDYLVAWDNWARELEKNDLSKYGFLEVIVFCLILPLVIYRERKCWNLYKDLEKKQLHFNKVCKEEKYAG